MQLDVYVIIPEGRCEEALEFYKSVFGGSYEASRFDSGPPSPDIPDNWKQKIMHSTFKADGFSFMAADGKPGSVPTDSNVMISLSNNDEAEGERIFNGLAQGGQVTMPFEQTFWGARFGMLRDRFGIEWMLNSQQ